MEKTRFSGHRTLLVIALALGALLRFYGLDWGTDRQTGHFHRFHPDETTIVDSARLISADIKAIQSSYGKAPMYLLWAAAHTLGPLWGTTPFDLGDNASIRFSHLVGRAISATMGILVVFFAYRLGTAIGGAYTGALSAFLMAVSPGHIQQSHYYTVDPALAFWATLALLLMLRLPSKSYGLYLACGTVCGLAAGTRITGVYLGLPFLLIHFFPHYFGRPEAVPRSVFPFWERIRALPWKHIGLAAGAGAAVFLACEPFLILDPQHYFDTSDIRMFAPSVQVARGELIRVWTLYDINTTPFLFYITHLLRYALTIPVEIAAFIGIGLALWKRPAPALVMLAWLIPYFLLVGGLHTKPIRYVAPMLPLLIVLGAWACTFLGERLREHRSFRLLTALPALVAALSITPHGLAVARTYAQTDSRIQAARWVAEHIPEGSGVLVEHGGFPSAWMAPPDRYDREFTDSSYFIVSNHWALYSSQLDHFRQRVLGADWVILVEENRMVQFMSVPNHYWVGSEIYHRLDRGELGFERVAQFRNRPALGPWTRDETRAEPTVRAFDRPTVSIFRRAGEPSPEAVFDEWIQSVREAPGLPDHLILAGVEAFNRQDWDQARKAFEQALEMEPHFGLSRLLIAEIHLKNGRLEAAEREWNRAIQKTGDIPRYAFMGMAQAGLRAEGARYLETIAAREGPNSDLAPLAAHLYAELGLEHQQAGDHQSALDAYARAMDLEPTRLAPYANAAGSLMELGNLDLAEHVLDLASQRDSTYAPVQWGLARLARHRGNLDNAFAILENALYREPGNPNLQMEFYQLGVVYYEQGYTAKASETFEQLLSYNAEFPGLHYNLGVLRLGTGDYPLALGYFTEAARIHPGDADVRFALGSAYEALGETAQAIRQYRAILKDQPDFGPAKERLAALSP